jgi:hypothetical protein
VLALRLPLWKQFPAEGEQGVAPPLQALLTLHGLMRARLGRKSPPGSTQGPLIPLQALLTLPCQDDGPVMVEQLNQALLTLPGAMPPLRTGTQWAPRPDGGQGGETPLKALLTLP